MCGSKKPSRNRYINRRVEYYRGTFMHRQSKHLKIDLVMAFEDRNAEKENQGPL